MPPKPDNSPNQELKFQTQKAPNPPPLIHEEILRSQQEHGNQNTQSGQPQPQPSNPLSIF